MKSFGILMSGQNGLQIINIGGIEWIQRDQWRNFANPVTKYVIPCISGPGE
jgi:hypothetical protein